MHFIESNVCRKVTKMDKHRSMIHAYLAIKDDTTDKYQLATTVRASY